MKPTALRRRRERTHYLYLQANSVFRPLELGFCRRHLSAVLPRKAYPPVVRRRHHHGQYGACATSPLPTPSRSLVRSNALCCCCCTCGVAVWEEEDAGAQGGERDAWTHRPRRRVRLRRRTHLRLLQRHLHRKPRRPLPPFHFYSRKRVKLTFAFFVLLQHVTDLSGRETLVRITGKEPSYSSSSNLCVGNDYYLNGAGHVGFVLLIHVMRSLVDRGDDTAVSFSWVLYFYKLAWCVRSHQ
jgi:hypothetical protein